MTLPFILSQSTQAHDLPQGFGSRQVIGNLSDPDGFAFSPDGRIFISERITGRLLVATYNANTGLWQLKQQPFHIFDIPKDDGGNPIRRRSAGLRDIAFDPEFASNGYVYAFYMKHGSLQNRVVRIRTSVSNPDVSDGIEQLLIDLPFNSSTASGSHNGGAIEFGNDGKLYITTGDGWEGEFAGDPVQSLTTFTGKILRINPDGSIPSDNPFFTQTTGDHRAIYALGLRNPYSMSLNPTSGKLYVNEARGSNKGSVYIVEAGANYGHEGNSGIGTLRGVWANAADAGSQLVTGGAWYPNDGPFPQEYRGAYFVALWGSNSSTRGQISYIQSETDTSVFAFETNVGLDTANGPPVKPVLTRIGPKGDLYYMLTTYETDTGSIQQVRYTAKQTVTAPTFVPNGGSFQKPISVTLSTSTPNAEIRYTTDGSEPTTFSPLFSGVITVASTTIIQAKAFRDGDSPSRTVSASFVIGEPATNIPPIADAGEDQTITVGTTIPLDGSGSHDPDGDDDFLQDEQWTQVSGPTVIIQDASEEIAFVTFQAIGTYTFQLSISDGRDSATDQVTITVVGADTSSCLDGGLQALYAFREGSGTTVNDVSGVGAPFNLTIEGSGTSWLTNVGLALNTHTLIASSEPATKLIDAMQVTNAFSIDAWITTANVLQDGPARIVTISGGTTERNVTLGQGKFGSSAKDIFTVRLRTTDGSNNNNGEPSLATTSGTVRAAQQHVVYTRSSGGVAKIYVDGTEAAAGSIPGTFANWDGSYRLGLGNEIDMSRPWLGTLHRIAIYACALNSSEVELLFASGSNPQPTPSPQPSPTIQPSPTATIEPTEEPTLLTVTPTHTPVSTPTSVIKVTPVSTPTTTTPGTDEDIQIFMPLVQQ